jgi:dihydrofolate synthase/folylpolyglutamate synthase
MHEPDLRLAGELLNGLHARGIHYDLDAMRAALAARGHPERRFPSLIIAGTNGKGSTAALLYWMLRRLGYRVGLYTSPHLIDVRERIRIEGMIPAETLARWILAYEAGGLLSTLTYYEALTLAALDWFAEEQVEWAILEVGVGGRLDAVNLAPASGAVITSIDFDHKEILGDTLAKIAFEKAGVIKESRPLVLGDVPAAAGEVIENAARERGAPIYRAGQAFTVQPSGAGFVYEGLGQFVAPRLGLRGAYQGENLGCALGALERIVGIDAASGAEALRATLAEAVWPGRFQRVGERPFVLVDSAHNPAGARALVNAFRAAYGGVSPQLVFAAFADKDHNAELAALRALGDRVWLTTIPAQSRGATIQQLQADPALAGAAVEVVPPETLHARIRGGSPDETYLVTGSIAFVGWFLEQWDPALARM